VELFNGLVSNRVRRGLYPSYVEHEDNNDSGNPVIRCMPT
jgi:hypothetical protein